MSAALDDIVAALHPLRQPPAPPAWNHANLAQWIGTTRRTPASVLLAIRENPQPRVVFTLRRSDLPDHPGQVSLPGGRAEADDKDALATALREAEEETDLHAADATPLGYLDLLDTVSNYRVTPVVARLADTAALVPAPAEVAEIFEVPLGFLLDPANLKLITIDFGGRSHQLFEYVGSSPRIWGVTADIFANLLVRMGRLDAATALASHTSLPEAC
ncbi:MAG: CoA pyrophosphatase, partial [Sinobacteraceae bacterium]|nr:CoA pyrophosphatase [Nevskiaceae bacterium]